MEYAELPDILFSEEDAAAIQQDVITVYEGLAGRSLQPADPVRLFLSSLAAIIVQQKVLINQTAKGNLLRYASGAVLDHMGAFQGSERLNASAAIVTLQFVLSIPLASATSIPTGTRVGAQGGNGSIFFSTTEYVEIPAGETAGIATAVCSDPGAIGNGFLPGQINVLMDPLPFVQSVSNLTISSGGAAAETDEAFKERIRNAPESYSTAGPQGAYEFWAKSASSAIIDVHAYSPAEGRVTVVPLLADGEVPSQDVLDSISETLEDRGIRPLTDLVTVSAPQPVSYNTIVTYYISRSRASEVSSIQEKISAAVTAYQRWQKVKLGRHVNPSELISRIMAAGAQRVVPTAPVYTILTATQVAQTGTTTITFGGLVDD
ncbi:baseplate assembly protein [Paenibacillus riograndensis]|uniref:Baseplate J protein n=2 Tax=Paenibacillus riograndensis TaxID=483937 RepID=A0A132U530_9BACL|nr:baseplate J/gp47 family protein [Paenibacillus riograndensis]KWX78667.1 baseplate J protein [Paenibacillus riograndensis]CQR58440.1 baseplate J family protein [Paenibacillus riograndensis SBR5]